MCNNLYIIYIYVLEWIKIIIQIDNYEIFFYLRIRLNEKASSYK